MHGSESLQSRIAHWKLFWVCHALNNNLTTQQNVESAFGNSYIRAVGQQIIYLGAFQQFHTLFLSSGGEEVPVLQDIRRGRKTELGDAFKLATLLRKNLGNVVRT